MLNLPLTYGKKTKGFGLHPKTDNHRVSAKTTIPPGSM